MVWENIMPQMFPLKVLSNGLCKGDTFNISNSAVKYTNLIRCGWEVREGFKK